MGTLRFARYAVQASLSPQKPKISGEKTADEPT